MNVYKVGFLDEREEKKFERIKHGKSEEKELGRWLSLAFDCLQQNPFRGEHIPKRLIPKEYRREGIKNLWKHDLPNAWRLLYTIDTKEQDTIVVIIDWMTHREYEKKMKYKTR